MSKCLEHWKARPSHTHHPARSRRAELGPAPCARPGRTPTRGPGPAPSAREHAPTPSSWRDARSSTHAGRCHRLLRALPSRPREWVGPLPRVVNRRQGGPMAWLRGSAPSFRLASAGKPWPWPREASPEELSLGLPCSARPAPASLRSRRVRRRRRHGPVSDSAWGASRESARGAQPPPPSAPQHGGRLRRASWRPEPGPPGSPPPPARALELPGPRASPAAARFPRTSPLCSSQGASAGRIRVARKGGGGRPAWPRGTGARPGAGRGCWTAGGSARRGCFPPWEARPWRNHYRVDWRSPAAGPLPRARLWVARPLQGAEWAAARAVQGGAHARFPGVKGVGGREVKPDDEPPQQPASPGALSGTDRLSSAHLSALSEPTSR